MKPDWRHIETEIPGLFVQSAMFIGEGWCSRAYLVNAELVFRFPKNSTHWPELDREIKFLAWAADHLPLAVPRYIRVAPDSPSAPNGYSVYGYLRGGPVDVEALTPASRSAAAQSVANFLQALHGLQPNSDLAARLPREDDRVIAEECLARAEREILPHLETIEAHALCRQFETYLGTPENFSFRPVVLHADLSRDHVLIDNDAVAGVLDFGDVNWGDRDYDFHYLFLDFGEAFAMDVARRYGHPDTEQLLSKVRYFTLVDQIGTILECHGRPLEGQVDAAWARVRQMLRSRAGRV
jgi:aminoglycoside 2''-phosphotransferase